MYNKIRLKSDHYSTLRGQLLVHRRGERVSKPCLTDEQVKKYKSVGVEIPDFELLYEEKQRERERRGSSDERMAGYGSIRVYDTYI